MAAGDQSQRHWSMQWLIVAWIHYSAFLLSTPNKIPAWICGRFAFYGRDCMLVPRHSFTTRLLLACISSKLYHGHETLDDLFADIARQACELASNGITALWLIIVHFAIRTFPQNPMILCCLAPTCLRPRARLKATPSNFWRLDWKVIGPFWERPCAWSKFVGFPYSVFGKCLIPSECYMPRMVTFPSSGVWGDVRLITSLRAGNALESAISVRERTGTFHWIQRNGIQEAQVRHHTKPYLRWWTSLDLAILLLLNLTIVMHSIWEWGWTWVRAL